MSDDIKSRILYGALEYCSKEEYKARRKMSYLRHKYPFRRFYMRKYWKLERLQAQLFRGVIKFRQLIVNHEKERKQNG